MDYTKPYDV